MKKNVFITGSGSGLGKNAAVELARRGHTVFASVHYKNEISDLERIAKKENLKLVAFKLDILDEEDRNIILNYPIDVLICNAAVGDSGSVSEVFVDRIEYAFRINVFANLRLVQLALQNMIEQKHGRIIFLSSLVGRIPLPFLSPYCATKSAIETFATCLRSEMKELTSANIEVGIIEPGAYATGFNWENTQKKWKWMEKQSYFLDRLDSIQKKEEIMWNLLERRNYRSIIKKYIRVVEDKKLKHRYYAPWWQAMFVQLGRIIGM